MAKNPWDDLPDAPPDAVVAKNPWDDLPDAPPEEPPASPVEDAPPDNMAPLRALATQGREADLQGLDALGNFFSLGAVPAMAGGWTKAFAPGPGVKAGPGAQPAPDDTPDVRAAKEAFLAQQGEELTPYATASAATKARSEGLRAQNPEFYTGMQLAPLAAPAATLAPLGGALLGLAGRGAAPVSRALRTAAEGAPDVGRALRGIGLRLSGKSPTAVNRALRDAALLKEGKAIAQGVREAEALANAAPQGLSNLQTLGGMARGVGAAAGKGALRGGLAGGAAGGLAGDEALARGDVAGFLKSMAVGGAAGGALGGIGGAASGLGGELAKSSAQGVTKAEEKIAEKAAEKQSKAVASASGELGGESQKASRLLKTMLESAQDKDLSPVLRQEAADFLASPEGVALRENVIRNVLRDAPSQVGRVTAKQQALQDLIAASEGNIAKDIETGKSIKDTLKTQVLPRFWTMGSRVIPTAVGSAIGGIPGTAAGTALAATMGNPTTIIKNMINNAAVQRAAAVGMGQLARPLSGLEAPLTRAAPLAGAAAGAQFQPLQQFLTPEDEAALAR